MSDLTAYAGKGTVQGPIAQIIHRAASTEAASAAAMNASRSQRHENPGLAGACMLITTELGKADIMHPFRRVYATEFGDGRTVSISVETWVQGFSNVIECAIEVKEKDGTVIARRIPGHTNNVNSEVNPAVAVSYMLKLAEGHQVPGRQ